MGFFSPKLSPEDAVKNFIKDSGKNLGSYVDSNLHQSNFSTIPDQKRIDDSIDYFVALKLYNKIVKGGIDAKMLSKPEIAGVIYDVLNDIFSPQGLVTNKLVFSRGCSIQSAEYCLKCRDSQKCEGAWLSEYRTAHDMFDDAFKSYNVSIPVLAKLLDNNKIDLTQKEIDKLVKANATIDDLRKYLTGKNIPLNKVNAILNSDSSEYGYHRIRKI